MATKVTFFPALNGIVMRKKDVVLPNWRNFYDFDEASLLQALRRGAITYPYKQKVQYTDRQTLYFFTNAYYDLNGDTTANGSVYLALVNCKGEIIEEKDPIADAADFVTEPYTYKSGDIEEETDIYIYRWRFNDTDYPPGEYYLYVKVIYDDTTEEEYLSEPIHVATKHKKTARIAYSHREDDHEVLFNTLAVDFNIRLDTDWMKLIPKGEETTYTEQDAELRRIYGQYYRCFELSLFNVPEYRIDQLARILTNCAAIFIEEKRYLKEAGAEVEHNIGKNAAVGTATVELRQYFNDRDGLFINTSVSIMQRPGTYPYLFPGFYLTDGLRGGYIDIAEIIDATAETAYVANLNSNVAVKLMDADGTFSFVGDTLTYQNAPGENFQLFYAEPVFDNPTEVTYETVLTNGPVNISYRMTTNEAGYVVWVDAAKVYTRLIGPANTFLVAQHTFSATGTKVVRVYANERMDALIFERPTSPQTANITLINGGSGERLRDFYMVRQSGYGSLDLSFLQDARLYLRYLNLVSCGITDITNDWMSTAPNWRMLKEIRLNNNSMNTAASEAFIINFEQYSGYTYGGYILLDSEPLSGPALAAIARLNAAGWGVFW